MMSVFTPYKNGFRLAMVFATFVLVACTAIHTPPAYMPSKAITPGETITVEGGQNVYAIAQQYNVSMRDLIVLNNLQPPFALKPGQKLVLPAGDSGGGMARTAPVPMPAPV